MIRRPMQRGGVDAIFELTSHLKYIDLQLNARNLFNLKYIETHSNS